jgi:hypothetical protein
MLRVDGRVWRPRALYQPESCFAYLVPVLLYHLQSRELSAQSPAQNADSRRGHGGPWRVQLSMMELQP